ncbi:MAG: UDP-N-acetylmuramate--L-alanine ligase [Candidatus Kapabacteria bacterium]|nr:UDP-N-acetylmuramate--L-alanine ligase [Candidatus Kapabacteria bacterium]MDW8012815.1 UDP-N-acetylmuramate--L-alanine ligase [Bacteroidota bacterium]
MFFTAVHRIHFVGIGGIGMSGLAEILLQQGFSVSGSDLVPSENTEHLERKGALIYYSHDAAHIEGAEVVVYSSAVNPRENPETRAALERGIPLLRRAEMLAEVARLKYCLAVAGTHGKTTTTSLCGLLLLRAGMDPTVIVGGRLRGLGGSNARLGRGEWIVVEADEYDRSFLCLLPTIAVVTSVEEEHMDIYADRHDILDAFARFANNVPFYGLVVACVDDDGVKELLPRLSRKVRAYGLSPQSEVRGRRVRLSERSAQFELFINGEFIGEITLRIPGLHNVRNALGAIAVGWELGIPFEVIREALEEFTGVYRRFEIVAERDGILFVDDYAHHPTEVRATLQAARQGWDRRLVCIFQPHTYTRTRDFAADFGKAFEEADILIVTDVYAAREQPIPEVSGELIVQAARRSGHRAVHYAPTLEEAAELAAQLLQPGDMLLTLGAGNIYKLHAMLGVRGGDR